MGTNKLVTFYCSWCDKEHQSHKYSSGQKYCSNACQMEAQRHQKIDDWIDGKWTNGAKNFQVRKWQKEHLLERAGYKCQCCGQSDEWNGRPLVLQADHIDGDASNNDRDNFQILCPNCHSQTTTYGNKGGRTSARVRV